MSVSEIKPFYRDSAVTIHHGNALALPLEDASVDLVVTSPPYFGLRSYQDDGEHYEGQIGSEATPAEFVDALVAATAEMVRVLKPSGSIWVNLGDKYATRSAGLAKSEGQIGSRAGAREANRRRPPAYPVARDAPRPGALRDKSLIGIPWRYALRCMGYGTALADPSVVRLLLRDVAAGVIPLSAAEELLDELAVTPDDGLGLILRAEVIWSKPNGLPESVTDRVRRSHETWFHMTKAPRYFSAVDEVREAHSPDTHTGRTRSVGNVSGNGVEHRKFAGNTDAYNPLGKVPGSVWEIPTQPLRVPDHLGIDHFAAFPMEWPRRIIRGWSPSGVCVECGEGRRPVADKIRTSESGDVVTGAAFGGGTRTGTADGRRHTFRTDVTITGEACACPEPTAPTRPAVVLDPFGGTGTTALVARSLGRQAIHVDMSADYCRLAQWRVTDPGERARAMQVTKPEPPPADIPSLLDLIEATA